MTVTQRVERLRIVSDAPLSALSKALAPSR
jgi:hypothetical protein